MTLGGKITVEHHWGKQKLVIAGTRRQDKQKRDEKLDQASWRESLCLV